MLVHENTYRYHGIAGYAHRKRLKKILSVLRTLAPGAVGKWADFGCSNGFILERIQAEVFDRQSLPRWEFYGFDHNPLLIDLAREKNLPNTRFQLFDLGEVDASCEGPFDVVSCFETLEHTGNYRNAAENLYRSCRKAGKIVISVPNEVGGPGLVKFIGRRVLGKGANDRAFTRGRTPAYVLSLITNGGIGHFRSPDAKGWATHLGFDYREFESHLKESYLDTGRCRIAGRYLTLLGMNIIYILERIS